MLSVRTVSQPDGIISGVAGTSAFEANANIHYYFGNSTDTFHGLTPLQGEPGTQQDYVFTEEAIRAYASADLVTNLNFQHTLIANQADMALFGASDMGDDLLGGWHLAPGDFSGGSFGVIHQTNSYMPVDPQYPGDASKRSYVITHEIGHGLGLGHAHDTSNGSTMVLSGTALDNELYTLMSYHSARELPGVDSDLSSDYSEYGFPVTFMALDIAALQYMYGADMTAYTGATSYQLFDKGAAALDTDGSDGAIGIGRALYSIWDAGGADQIAYTGGNRVIINLNDATLNTDSSSQSPDLIALGAEVMESGAAAGLDVGVVTRMTNASYYAGGFFSHILDADGRVEVGGYSIANGAIIENAIGGSNDDILVGNEQANAIRGNGGSDYLFGGTGNDYLLGGAGSDDIFGGAGNDSIDGELGYDTASLFGLRGAGHDLIQFGGNIYAIDGMDQSYDTLVNVEAFQAHDVAITVVPQFDPLAYAASYDDLAHAFGLNYQAALNHYLQSGFSEGREVSFDAGQYLSNYADLSATFGTNGELARNHFLSSGVNEGRLAEDPLDYIASYADLIMAFQGQSGQQLIASGLSHYTASGLAEGRRGNISFDAAQYLENFADLTAVFGDNDDAAAAHYIQSGYTERRLAADPLTYIASYDDLIGAFGTLSVDQMRAASIAHYQGSGASEGRSYGIDFDADHYLTNYPDLQAAFIDTDGTYNEDAATLHYIQAGFGEGRTDVLLA